MKILRVYSLVVLHNKKSSKQETKNVFNQNGFIFSLQKDAFSNILKILPPKKF